MKKFIFRYERILQVRVDKENEVRHQLAKVNQMILDKEQALHLAEDQYSGFLNQLNEAFEAGVFAGDMQSRSFNKQYLIDQIKRTQQELEQLLQQRKDVQVDLIEANKQRKIMEKLKEKEIDKYKALEALEEAKLVDQIVTYQSKRTKGE